MDTNIKFLFQPTTTHDYITDNFATNFYNLKSSAFNDIYNLDSHSDGIDIYFMGTNVKDICGNTQHIPGLAFFVTQELHKTTLAHEMGHCLGLYHTHHGTYEPDGGKAEYVDGSNAKVAGDYVLRTPADPNKWDSSGNYNGGALTDAHGDLYNPDPYNLMSYNHALRRNFTEDQIIRMHHFLQSNVLSSACIHPSVSGPSHFNKTGTYTFSGMDGDNIVWTVVAYTPAYSGDDAGLKSATTTYEAETLTLDAGTTSTYFEIYASLNGVKSNTLCATANAPSPSIGTLLWESTNGATGATTAENFGETLSISSNGCTLTFGYEDKAGNSTYKSSFKSMNYMCVTPTRRVLSGSGPFTFYADDCSQGFLKFRLTDECGASDAYFTLLVEPIGAYYSFSYNDESATLEFEAVPDKQLSAYSANSTSSPMISIEDIVVRDASGSIVYQCSYPGGTSSIQLDTTGWAAGEYAITLSNRYYSDTRTVTIY